MLTGDKTMLLFKIVKNYGDDPFIDGTWLDGFYNNIILNDCYEKVRDTGKHCVIKTSGVYVLNQEGCWTEVDFLKIESGEFDVVEMVFKRDISTWRLCVSPEQLVLLQRKVEKNDPETRVFARARNFLDVKKTKDLCGILNTPGSNHALDDQLSARHRGIIKMIEGRKVHVRTDYHPLVSCAMAGTQNVNMYSIQLAEPGDMIQCSTGLLIPQSQIYEREEGK